MRYNQELLKIYRQFPCRILPNAFWKTAARMGSGALDIQYGSEGELKSIKICQDGACLAFWCANPSAHHLSSDQFSQLNFALVHESSLPAFSKGTFRRRQPYFRVHHEGAVKRFDCPPGFIIKDVRPEAEVEAVSRIIHDCYSNMNVNPETVQEWLGHTVYDPDLWVWIVESGSGQKVGLGIAEFDARVPEASLEWIQVLPEFHNRGLGSAIVAQLLARVEGKVQFTTVSGELDNPTQPEGLYRKCGFVGSDIWWLLAP